VEGSDTTTIKKGAEAGKAFLVAGLGFWYKYSLYFTRSALDAGGRKLNK
jgi:hypothetical protein